ncbi:MAG: phage tail spike protein, partial [Candidatus Faecousia sp.]|nr:phage tail spike protein [Candidatus Faecousia sp.]
MYKVKLDGYVLYHADHPSAMLTDPVLELEPGYAGVFTATVPPDNPLYNRIYCRKSMLSVFRNNTEIFYGEVRKIPNIDRYRNKQIYCTGALSFLADSIQPQAEYHDISPAVLLGRMLEIHNSQVEPRKQIKLGYVSITDPNNSLYRYTNYENTLEAIRDKLVGRLGGYLRLRHEGDQLILDWVGIEQYGNYSTQPIEFGLNLLDYSETTSAEDVVTALIPLGATLEGESEIEALEKRVDITSVNDGKNYVFSQDAVDQFGWVWATNTWDDVTVPANLKTKAEEWLSSTQFETMSLKLTAADLSELGHDYDAFAEGDRIHCLAKPYGMDIVLPVMKLTIPLQNPAGRTLELSSKQQKTYTSQQSAVRNQLMNQQNDAINISNRNIQISIDNLTAMMTGAKGGYKLTEYDEDGRWLRDLYMDTPDKTTAKRIMQINKDGIAASTTGYEGPYTVGITVDGQILGSWIAANSIDTNQLSIGLNNWIKGTDDGIAASTTGYEGPYTVGITVDGQILGSWIAANSIDTNQLSIGLNAWIKGTDDGLASKVEKDGIISAINQSSEEVAIQAKRINLNGSVTANNYFKIKTDGSMEAIAGRIGGFNINSDYISFGDWTHASNWLSMCTPHGGAGDVYLGKGGISTDSFDGQSGSIVRSIKMTEGTIGFYKGAYECGFVGVSDSNEIRMSLMDKEK